MAVTRINNNQITDASTGNVYVGINASTKVQDFSVTAGKLANSLVYGSDLTISGNLTVNGQTTTIDTVSTVIEDPVIVLASNQTGSPSVDIGFIGERGTANNIAFVWDESVDEFVTAFTSDLVTNTTITISSYANFHTNDANIGGNITINGTTTLVGNISSALNVTGNITGGNLLTPGVVTATGNITGGNVSTAGQVTATGNVSGGNINLSGNIVDSGALTIITGSGNISLSPGGTTSVVATTTGANITGTLNATGNANVGNLGTAGQVVATGNVTGGNLVTTGLVSAGTTITATGNITGGNVSAGSGTISTTGNINGGNVNATTGVTSTTVTATGNITGGNISTTGSFSASSLSVSGNITGGNLISNALVSGTTITATGNVSGGNVITVGNVNGANVNATSGITAGTTIVATGNVSGGNITTAGNISGSNLNVSANVTGGNVSMTGNVSATGNITGANLVVTTNIYDANALNIVTGAGNLNLQPAGNIVVNNTYINGLLQPVQNQDAATKLYVDNAVTTAISYHDAVVAATIGNLNAATGGTVTYNQPNGAGNGQGATLTTTGSFNLIDTANVQTVGTRILVKDQANAVQNGVYVWSNATVITRASTEDTYAPATANALSINDYFFVSSGNVNAGSAWIVDSPAGTITFGTSNILFAQFSQSQVYSANTAAGLNLTGTVFSAKVDNNTTAFDGSGNIIVKAGANLTTPNIGAATGTSLNVTGNVIGGNLTTGGQVSATGNVSGGNVTTVGQVVATGNVTGGNLITLGITSTGSLTASTTINATGNVTGGNLTTAGQVVATGNITGGNVSAGSGIISTTGNVSGGNLTSSGQVVATGNVNGAGAVFSGNVTASNFIGNISGNIDAGGANTNIQFNDGDILAGSAAFTFNKTSNAVVASGNVSAGNLTTAGQVVATGNVNGGNLVTGGIASVTGNVNGGNLVTAGQVVATGNVNGGNVVAVALVTGANVTATANVTGANVVGTTSGTFANIRISTSSIDGPAAGRITINGADADVDFAVDGDTLANVFYVDAGTGTASFGTSTQTTNALVAFNASTSILMPVGNTAQRPGTGVTGMMRFNSTTNSVEVYNNSAWTAVGVPVFTVIDDQQFNGDGSTVAFTINSNQTTNSCIVSINGVVQIPTIAYSVTGTTLTFTEAPEPGDRIDVRQLTTTTSVISISNTSGNAIVQVSDTTNDISITGDLIPTGNVTQDLGSPTQRWRDGYFSGSSLILGNVVMKNVAGGNSIGFFGPDGTTPATIAASSVDTTQIASGTSSVSVIATNGNIRSNVGGTTVQTISPGLVAITGDLSVTGNATLSGNILGDRIQNGTTQIDIQTPNGNANITIGGTSNVAVFSTTGANITGALGVTGNISAANLNITGDIVDTGAFRLVTGASGNVTLAPNGSNVLIATTTGANIAGTLNATGAITGASLGVSTGNITGGNLILSGAIEDSAQLDIRTTASNGNIVLTPNGSGVIVVAKDIVNGQANGVGNIGSATGFFNTVFAKATSAQYADLAEKYVADAEYAPGTVVVFGGDKEVTVTSTDADRAVAGVVSTNPSYIMNAGLEAEHVATVALTGRVPCRVTGTVCKGDLMVSAGYGVARAEADPRVGTVIGKALENYEGTEGVIEVVVGRF
jgi:hypothetical protein